MGFRFQKRIKLLPGVTINLSKKGVSTSLGTTGARVTLGHGQKRTTVGLPGTGLSHTQVTRTKSAATQRVIPDNADAVIAKPTPSRRQRILGLAFIVAFVVALLVIFLTNQGNS